MQSVENPKITFLLPYRLFKEDKEHLGANMVRKIRQFTSGGDDVNFPTVPVYRVMVAQTGWKPAPVEISARDMTKMLKPIFPNGKCIQSDSYFIQGRSKTVLPFADVQIFF